MMPHLPLAAVVALTIIVALVARPGAAFRHEPGTVAETSVPLLLSRPSSVAVSRRPVPPEVIDTVAGNTAEALLAPLHIPTALPPRGKGLRNGSLPRTRTVNEPGWDTISVARGQTLSGLFDEHGLPPTEWMALLKVDHEHVDRLNRLREGDQLHIRRDGKRLTALQLPIDEFNRLHFVRNDNGFTAEMQADEVERREAYAVGEIASSLFLSGQRAGLSDYLIMSMVEVLGYDIDFALELRTGDRFAVIYEELYRDGEKLRDGNILAVEFINRGRTVQAFRHTLADGRGDFFRADGEAVRTAFLRNPLDVFRISSHFNPNRRHPVLNTIRAHRGTDYAAPTGTPIRATGEGVVELAGRHGGYGTAVILQHGSRYRTLYAHMSRVRSGIRRGTRVRQGQVIGYVGMSGLATGPHLHYEFLVDGAHRNPVTVPLPRSEPLPDSERPAFATRLEQYTAQLDTLRGTETAAHTED